MKRNKTYKFALVAVLALMGASYAENNAHWRYDEADYKNPLHFVGNLCTIEVKSVKDFDIYQSVDSPKCVNDKNTETFVFDLKSDILVSEKVPTANCALNTFNVDVKNKDVVIRGHGFAIKNLCFGSDPVNGIEPLFSNVANLYVDSLTVRDVKIPTTDVSFGIFAENVQSTLFNQVSLNKVDASVDQTIKNFGLLVGQVSGPAFLHNMKGDSLFVAGGIPGNMGGLIGYVGDSLFVDKSNLKFTVVLEDRSSIQSHADVNLGCVVGLHEQSNLNNKTKTSLSYFAQNAVDCEFKVKGSVDGEFLYGSMAVGGLVGSERMPYLDYSSIEVSGSIDVSSSIVDEASGASRKYAFGGFNGTWSSDVADAYYSLDNCKSSLTVKSILLPYGNSDNQDLAYIGGLIGSSKFIGNADVKLSSVEFSGKIDVNMPAAQNLYVGGLVSFFEARGSSSSKLDFSNLSLADSKKGIVVSAASALIGGGVGCLYDASFSVTGNNNFEKNINASLGAEGSSSINRVGGFIGYAREVGLSKVEHVNSKANLNVSFAADGFFGGIADVGSLLGFLNCESENTSAVNIENTAYSGRIVINDAMSAMNIGGYIGRTESCSELNIGYSMAENDTLILVGLANDFPEEMNVGGLIGLARGRVGNDLSSNLNLYVSYVSGNVFVQPGLNINSESLYVSGVVGRSVQAKNDYRVAYYAGILKLDVPNNDSLVNYLVYLDKSNLVLRDGFSWSPVKEYHKMYSMTKGSKDNIYDFFLYDSSGMNLHWPSKAFFLNSKNVNSKYFAYKNGDVEDYSFWYVDTTKNDARPMLRYVPGAPADALPTAQYYLEEENFDYLKVLLTDYRGKIVYDAEGPISDSTLLIRPHTPRVFDSTGTEYMWVATDSKGNSVLWEGIDKTYPIEYLLFKMVPVANLAITFKNPNGVKLDSNSYWNGNDFNIATSDSLPSVAFLSNSVYYRGNRWHVENDASNEFTTLNQVRAYAASKNLQSVDLVYSTDVQKCEEFNSSWFIVNLSSLRISATFFDRDFNIKMVPNYVGLPHIDKFKIVDVNGDTALRVFDVMFNGVTKRVLTGDVVDLTGINTIVSVTYCAGCEIPADRIPVEPDSTDSTKVGPVPNNNGNSHVKVAMTEEECREASRIENADVLMSGTAARFVVEMFVPTECSKVRAKVSVKDSEGNLWLNDSLPSKSGKKKFTLYPLNPGKYKFNVKVSSTNKKTVTREISTKVKLMGGEWHMVSVGTWPKNALKGVGASMFSWDETVGFGEYWQYQALPSLKDANELEGYWLYTEKNAEFNLAMPLKKAESDSFAWDVKKVFHGWNMVGNPYSWNIYSGSIDGFMSAENGKSPIWRWNSKNASYEVADTLFANESFWVKVGKSMKIRVSSAPVFPSLKKDTAMVLKKASATRNSWSMRLVASTADGSNDAWNVIGVGSKNISIEKPPSGYGSTVSVGFVDNNDGCTLLAKSIYANSASAEDGYTWKMNVSAGNASSMKLSLDGIDEVKSLGYRVVLVDGENVVEWGDSKSIDVKASSTPKNVLLKVVKADAAVAPVVTGIGDLRFSAIAGSVNVVFDISSEMAGKNVSVRLVSVDGKVSSMASGVARAGTNEFNIGKGLRSGVYVLQVRVGSENRTMKMAL